MIRGAMSNLAKILLSCGAALALLAAAPQASAQAASAVADGIAFAKAIAPTSSSQLVNPNAVSSSAWSGNTATPTAVPGTLGTFSAPNLSTTPYTTAKAIGLSAYGTQATVNCATYDPNTGDATQAQTCAAVNFLTNRCLSPTTKQGAILVANATSTSVTGDCSGTYGQAQAGHGFAEQESSSDSIFTGVTNLGSTASAITSQTCSVQTVITAPAQYATVNCVKNDSTAEYSCYQYLNTAIQTTYSPATPATTCAAPSVLQRGYCVSQSSSPGTIVYGCPPGQTLNGSSCVSTSSTPGTPIYSCPPGDTLNGTTCSGNTTVAPVASNICPHVAGAIQQDYVAGTLKGVTGYCEYLWWQRDFGEESSCASAFANAPDGATLFSTATILPKGRYGIRTACYTYAERVCPSGSVWNGLACEQPSTTSATITGYTCASGTLSGSTCTVTVSDPATPSYQCPSGSVLSGSQCVTTTNTPPTVSYSCPNGSAPVSGLCVTPYVVTSWVDTCGAYETSAGITLPTPH